MVPFSLMVIFVKDAAPSPSVSGTAYSIAHLVHCIALTVAPGFTSTLFSFSADSGWFGGYFVWVFMFCASVGVVASAFRMRIS